MNSNVKSSIKIIAAVITISIAAQLTIDIGSIPITGQTLAILTWAFFLSYKESILALLLYLMLGIVGAPVFADGAYSIEKLYGGSGGFLIGFLIAAAVVSYLFDYLKSSSFSIILGLSTLGTFIILLLGTGRLMVIYGVEKGISYGFLPFWQGALVKIILGSILVWSIRKYILSKKT